MYVFVYKTPGVINETPGQGCAVKQIACTRAGLFLTAPLEVSGVLRGGTGGRGVLEHTDYGAFLQLKGLKAGLNINVNTMSFMIPP